MPAWKKVVVESSSGTIAQATSGAAATLSTELDETLGGTGQTSITKGDMLYGSAANTIAKLGAGTTGQVLKMSSSDAFGWATDLNSGGTVTSVTVGTGLDISNGTTTPAISLDLSELTDGTDAVDADDELIYLDDGSQKRKAFSEVGLSEFSNDSSFTSNSGTITAVTITTDTGGGSKMTDSTASADFSLVSASGCSVSNVGNTATVTVAGNTGLTADSDGLSITASGVSAASYTNADITVNASGQVTAAASGTVALGSEVSGSLPMGNLDTVTIANGGTGTTSAAGAASAFGVGTEDSPTFTGAVLSAGEGAACDFYMKADEGDDAGDEWKISVADGGAMTFANDKHTAGTYVTQLTITPAAAATDSVVTIAGDLTVNGDTTTVNTATLQIEDKLVTVAKGAGSAANASASGIEVMTTNAAQPSLQWLDGGGGTGWAVYQEGNATVMPIATMSVAASDGSGANNPVGGFHYNTGGSLWLRVS